MFVATLLNISAAFVGEQLAYC